MILDVNVLINAHNSQSTGYEPVRAWLLAALRGPRTVGIPLVTSLGFLRIVTNPRALDPPLTMPQAHGLLAAVLAAPAAVEVDPAAGHWERMLALAADTQLSGAETTDVHLAALSLERGASLVTHDRGFRRFRDLDVIEPA